MLYYLLIVNLLLFSLMGIDKWKAIHQRFRIPEKTLLFLGMIGGGPCGFLAGRIFHHKTKKFYFQLVWFIGSVLCFAGLYYFYR